MLVDIRHLIDPLDSEDDEVREMINLKTPTRNLKVKCAREALLYFKVHLMQKMRSNFESIDDQMMCRDVPRLVETCTSHIERYGLRVRKVYQNKLLEIFLIFGLPWTCGRCLLPVVGGRKMIAHP